MDNQIVNFVEENKTMSKLLHSKPENKRIMSRSYISKQKEKAFNAKIYNILKANKDYCMRLVNTKSREVTRINNETNRRAEVLKEIKYASQGMWVYTFFFFGVFEKLNEICYERRVKKFREFMQINKIKKMQSLYRQGYYKKNKIKGTESTIEISNNIIQINMSLLKSHYRNKAIKVVGAFFQASFRPEKLSSSIFGVCSQSKLYLYFFKNSLRILKFFKNLTLLVSKIRVRMKQQFQKHNVIMDDLKYNWEISLIELVKDFKHSKRITQRTYSLLQKISE